MLVRTHMKNLPGKIDDNLKKVSTKVEKPLEKSEGVIDISQNIAHALELNSSTLFEHIDANFKAKILVPDCKTLDFPHGFGLELISTSKMHFEEFLNLEHQKIVELVRQYGALSVKGMDIKKVKDKFKIPFRTISNKTSTILPWHHDRDFLKDGRRLSAIILTQESADKARPIPTLAAPTALIVRFLKAEIQSETEKDLPSDLKKYYLEILSLPDQEFLSSIENVFNYLTKSKEVQAGLLKLLRKVEKKHTSSLLSHDWVENQGSILIINTEEEEHKKTCKVSHARIFDRSEIADSNDPRNQEYFLERAFIYS